MIEYSMLFNYGILGLWTLYLIIKERTTTKEFKQAIQDNTNAMISLKIYLKGINKR